MKPDLAEQNLQLIRTLMERSTIYRRALAPIMLSAGVSAVLASLFGYWFGSKIPFIGFWMAVCGLVVLGAILHTRRQAMRDKEPFWSPPTRRVAQAFLPAMVVGAVPTVAAWLMKIDLAQELVPFWAMLYGCALHAAGMFAPRALRRAGWLFILGGAVMLTVGAACPEFKRFSPHLMMGAVFGGLHLVCSVYLFVTEKRSNAL